MDRVVFMPWARSIPPDGRSDLLSLARDLGVPVPSACGGMGKCGKCRVIVVKTDGPLPDPSERERQALGNLVEKGHRLACETVLASGALVEVPKGSRPEANRILTADSGPFRSISPRPRIELLELTAPLPDPSRVEADRERLLDALWETHRIRRATVDHLLLRKLPRALRAEGNEVTLALRDGKEIVDLYPGRRRRLFGMSFDVGTTTVVGALADLRTGKRLSIKAALNPQIPFGEDVVSRISFCQRDEAGVEKLRALIVGALNSLVEAAAQEANLQPQEILEATAVGNTVMHHLLMGLDPQYLTMAPYPPVARRGADVKARDIGLAINPSGYLHLLPLKAGFVGSDAVAGVLAAGIEKSKAGTLLVDIGTNGEIVLSDQGGLVCCSTAAGPAFEGGHIRWGMRASSGAIERVRIDPASLEVEAWVIDRGPPAGVCGSGLLSAAAEMLRAGILLAKGNLDLSRGTPRLRQGPDGPEFVLAWASETSHGRDIVVTQRDVAELQMAKSAVCAGATLLMERLKTERIGRVLLAGAGGSSLDPLDAAAIGLFPPLPWARVRSVGNAAALGAHLALVDRSFQRRAERIAEKMAYQELAGSPRFQELFVSNMIFASARDYEDVF